MPGNWTMSMMWMPMGGKLVAMGVFTVMWLAMMVAMMLPSTMPSRQVQQEGEVLSPASLVLAKRAGVKQPHQVRIKIVDQLPLPTEPLLRQAALQTGLLGPGMVGLRSATVFWLFADIWGQGFYRMNYDMYINMRFMAQLQGSCLSI